MAQGQWPHASPGKDAYVVPGTCFATTWPVGGGCEPSDDRSGRDPIQRLLYAQTALAAVPRLLGAIDRNPFRPTFGCMDRQYWHYRTAAFPSAMYEEGVLPLALAYTQALPGNPWCGHQHVADLAVAALRFAAKSSHPDGSCDDYYPFERALGAAVFSLQAAARAYELLQLRDAAVLQWIERRARWVARHDESGRLTNHHALAALALLRVWQITGDGWYRDAAERKLQQVLAAQHAEGWFEEYGGADPGYQTVTIDCLAKCRRLLGDSRLDAPLESAVRFARWFLHPDGGYGGHYGSRGTQQFYPHGMELLAGGNADAAELADGFLASLRHGTFARLDDDRMFIHRLGNLIEAYLDWSPHRAAHSQRPPQPLCHLPGAGMLVRQDAGAYTVVSTARGGVFKHFEGQAAVVNDAGLVVLTDQGRVAASQWHDRRRNVSLEAGDPSCGQGQPAPLLRLPATLCVAGRLHWCSFQTATPVTQAVFHLAMSSVGRWCRTAVRHLLQRRLITGRRECPIYMERRIVLLDRRSDPTGPSLRVTDTIELSSPKLRLVRMAYATDLEAAYVAASNVYQSSSFDRWVDLEPYVEKLNARRRVEIVREF